MKIQKSEYEKIKNLYLIEKKTTEEIAKIYKLSDYRIISRILKHKLNINLRTGKHAQVNSIIDKLNIDTLKKMYFDEYMSLNKIAAHFNCNEETIRMCFKKNDIKLRENSLHLKNSCGARKILSCGTEEEKNTLKDKIAKSKYKIDVDKIDEILKERKIERVEKYFRNDKKIKFRCLITGIIWYGYISKILRSMSIGGPFKRKQQTLTYMFLQEIFNNTIIQREKNIKINDKNLKVDFYFEVNNKKIIVEYNGLQHYKPIRFGGIDLIRAENNFIKQKKRDELLMDYCKINDIILIEIDCRKYENKKILSYLKEKFKEIGVLC